MWQSIEENTKDRAPRKQAVSSLHTKSANVFLFLLFYFFPPLQSLLLRLGVAKIDNSGPFTKLWPCCPAFLQAYVSQQCPGQNAEQDWASRPVQPFLHSQELSVGVTLVPLGWNCILNDIQYIWMTEGKGPSKFTIQNTLRTLFVPKSINPNPNNCQDVTLLRLF